MVSTVVDGKLVKGEETKGTEGGELREISKSDNILLNKYKGA